MCIKLVMPIQPPHLLPSPSPPALNLSQHQGLFIWSQFSTSGGRSIGASASASVPPKNMEDGFPLGLTGWISLLCKRLSRVFSNTIVQQHQFFGTQLYPWSNSHIHTWLPDSDLHRVHKYKSRVLKKSLTEVIIQLHYAVCIKIIICVF